MNKFVSNGLYFLNNNQLEKSVRCFKDAIKMNEKDADAWSNLAVAFYRLNNIQKALQAIEKALLYRRNCSLILFNKGILLLELKRYEEALDIYRDLTNQHPMDPSYWRSLGACFIHLDRDHEAMQATEQALSLDPNHASALSNKAYLYQKWGKHEEAVKIYKNLIKLHPKNPIYWQILGENLSEMLLNHEAMEVYRHNIQINPDYETSRLALSHLLIMEGDLEEGFKEFECWFKERKEIHTPKWQGEKIEGKTLFVCMGGAMEI